MKVTLTAISKSFGAEAVVRDLTHVLQSGSRTALLGPNGSGKSTLLQLIAGSMAPTAGTVAHAHQGSTIAPDLVYRHISIAAPYLGLYEELPLREVLELHAGSKPLLPGLVARDVAVVARLEKHMNKPVRNFSSGMKQRLKLALAILSDTALLLLDEPGSNLDADGLAWFAELLNAHLGTRTLVVASNRQQEETFACTASLGMERS